MFKIGDPIPWFITNSSVNSEFKFDTLAGRYVVLCFFCSAGEPVSKAVIEEIEKQRFLFDDQNLCFFGVSIDPLDQQLERVQNIIPGMRYFWDFNQEISKVFDLINNTEKENSREIIYYRVSVVLDERLRVLALFPFEDNAEVYVSRLTKFLQELPAISADTQAPVLIVPRIFEPQLCQDLISLYHKHGGEDSGFMREVDGKTVGIIDYSHKKRRDQEITDEKLRQATMYRLNDRLVPEIEKAFQFKATRIERHIVACYDATSGGYFRPHRDNTTKGTAHRRFAVTINLNAEDYEGGDLRFPEFGRQTYRAPTGGAVVFSCSLLHEATPVTKGVRYAYLPFLYDDAAAKIREMNKQFLVGGAPNNAPYGLVVG